MEAHSSKFKRHFRLRLQCVDGPTPELFASGLAILAQTPPPQARRLTWGYMPRLMPLRIFHE
jgi:hypothetical protein